MHVANRHGDQGGGHAGAGELHDIGIGAGSAGHALDLVGNLVFLRRLDEQIEHDRVDVRAAGNDGPFSELC